MSKNNTHEAADDYGIEVVLVMPHNHGGIDYTAGSSITVSQSQKQWLIAAGRVATDTDVIK